MKAVDTRDDTVNVTWPTLSREMEDQLDWLENQQRSESDIRSVDQAFVGGSLAVTLVWLVAGVGTVGGVVAVGTSMLLPLLSGQ